MIWVTAWAAFCICAAILVGAETVADAILEAGDEPKRAKGKR